MRIQTYVKTESEYVPWVWRMHRQGHRVIKISREDSKVNIVMELFYRIQKDFGVTFKSFSL
jgi:hypothetical protein